MYICCTTIQRTILLLLSLFLYACNEKSQDETGYIDRDRLRSEALALAETWIEHAPTPGGFQKTLFDGIWQPVGENSSVDLTAQSRLIYVYSAAYDLTGDKKYQQAARSAADFMLHHMRNAATGGWYKAVQSDGTPIDDSVHPYGYSFTIFGLAHAYRVTGDRRFLEAAMETWQSNVWPGLKAAKLFAATGSISKKAGGNAWSQNPYMHLFEAMLALYDNTGSQEVWGDIEAMASFLRTTLIQPCGCIPEWFLGSGFEPQYGDNAEVYLGHQVEWAYLLSQAVERGLDRDFLSVSYTLMDFAVDNGLNKDTGGLRAQSKMNGDIIDSNYWWWAQAELMRAAVHFARTHGRTELWDVYEKSHLFARIHFINQELGGWTDSSLFLSKTTNQDLRQDIGYHAMGFYTEALTVK